MSAGVLKADRLRVAGLLRGLVAIPSVSPAFPGDIAQALRAMNG